MKKIYFAYGSNMSTDRIKSRIKSARFVGIAKLIDKAVVFNKMSIDGSGKANIIEELRSITWGVLYEIDNKDFDHLDKMEAGYGRRSIVVKTSDGHSVTAEAYISKKILIEQVAYDWYKKIILDGAIEHKLPESYIRYLNELPSKPDHRYS